MGQLEQTVRNLIALAVDYGIPSNDRRFAEARQLVHRLDFLDRVNSRPDHAETIEIPPEALHGFPWTGAECAADYEESRQWSAADILAREG